jgi:hypothetical protein
MTKRQDPADRIRNAHSLVVKAANSWNAGSFAAVESCAAVLEESAAELRAAAAGSADSLRGLRREILQMKERVGRIERLSDLAAAFLRGGPESSGDSPLYRAGGLADSESSFRETTKAMAGIQA